MLMRIDDMDGLVEAVRTLAETDEDSAHVIEYMDSELPREWFGEGGCRAMWELKLRTQEEIDESDRDEDELAQLERAADADAFALLRSADIRFPLYVVATLVSYDIYEEVLVHWYDSDELCELGEFVRFLS